MITAKITAGSIGPLNLGALRHAPTNFKGCIQYRRVVEAKMEANEA